MSTKKAVVLKWPQLGTYSALFLRRSYVLRRIYAGAERLSMAHSIMHSQKRPPWFTTEGRLLSGVVQFLILKIMREAHNFSKPLFPHIILLHSLTVKHCNYCHSTFVSNIFFISQITLFQKVIMSLFRIFMLLRKNSSAVSQ